MTDDERRERERITPTDRPAKDPRRTTGNLARPLTPIHPLPPPRPVARTATTLPSLPLPEELVGDGADPKLIIRNEVRRQMAAFYKEAGAFFEERFAENDRKLVGYFEAEQIRREEADSANAEALAIAVRASRKEALDDLREMLGLKKLVVDIDKTVGETSGLHAALKLAVPDARTRRLAGLGPVLTLVGVLVTAFVTLLIAVLVSRARPH